MTAMQAKKNSTIHRILFTLGALCLTAGLGLVVKTFNDLEGMIIRDATVAGIPSQPNIEFYTQEGFHIIFQYPEKSDPPEFELKEHVQAIFPADDPNAAKLYRFSDYWLLPIILCLVGLVQLSTALKIARANKSKA